VHGQRKPRRIYLIGIFLSLSSMVSSGLAFPLDSQLGTAGKGRT